jgi:hypothetical protein
MGIALSPAAPIEWDEIGTTFMQQTRDFVLDVPINAAASDPLPSDEVPGPVRPSWVDTARDSGPSPISLSLPPTAPEPKRDSWSPTEAGRSASSIQAEPPARLDPRQPSRAVPAPNPAEMEAAVETIDRANTPALDAAAQSASTEQLGGFIDIARTYQATPNWTLDGAGAEYLLRTSQAGSVSGDPPKAVDPDMDDLDDLSHDANDARDSSEEGDEESSHAASEDAQRLASSLAPDPDVGGMIELSVCADQGDQDSVESDTGLEYAEQLVAAIEMDEACGVLRAFELACATMSGPVTDVSFSPPAIQSEQPAEVNVLASTTVIKRSSPSSAAVQGQDEGNQVTWRALVAVSAGGLVLATRRRRVRDYFFSVIGQKKGSSRNSGLAEDEIEHSRRPSHSISRWARPLGFGRTEQRSEIRVNCRHRPD